MSVAAERVKWFTKEVKRLAKNVKQIADLIVELKSNIAVLRKAKIVSLEEWNSTVTAIRMSKDNLAMAKTELAGMIELLEIETANARRVESMGKVVPFRKGSNGA